LSALGAIALESHMMAQQQQPTKQDDKGVTMALGCGAYRGAGQGRAERHGTTSQNKNTSSLLNTY
jgi:hypothetical protein